MEKKVGVQKWSKKWRKKVGKKVKKKSWKKSAVEKKGGDKKISHQKVENCQQLLFINIISNTY